MQHPIVPKHPLHALDIMSPHWKLPPVVGPSCAVADVQFATKPPLKPSARHTGHTVRESHTPSSHIVKGPSCPLMMASQSRTSAVLLWEAGGVTIRGRSMGPGWLGGITAELHFWRGLASGLVECAQDVSPFFVR